MNQPLQAPFFGKVREVHAQDCSSPRRPNAEYRTREYLTASEVNSLIVAAGKLGRHGHRDSTMILVAYCHGLRVSELVSLRWEQVDLKQGLLHVRRRKNGAPSTHPLLWSRDSVTAQSRSGVSGDALRVRHGAQRTAQQFSVQQDSRSCWGSCTARFPGASPHASSFYRVQARERWAGYARDSAHRPLH